MKGGDDQAAKLQGGPHRAGEGGGVVTTDGWGRFIVGGVGSRDCDRQR
jgi:hypothetical protein